MIEYMGSIFDWDPVKMEANKKKHGIDFYEAITIFNDMNHHVYEDEEHSDDEDRFIVIGYSEKNRILMACHCYRNGGNVTRIISARKATPYERGIYENGG